MDPIRVAFPRRIYVFALLTGLQIGSTPAEAAERANAPLTSAFSSSPAYQSTVRAFAGGGGKTGVKGRLGFDLVLLKAEYDEHLLNSPQTQFHSSIPGLETTTDSAVVVDIVAGGDPSALATKLKSVGLRNGAVAGHIVSGLLPISALGALAFDSDVRSVSPSYMVHRSGTVTTQGDAAQRSDLVRAFGLDGSGIKVGVLSDSYNAGGGAAANVTAGDLPGVGNPEGHLIPVQVIQDSVVGSDEGRAMLQLIHDVAPGASLAFATANFGIANFAANITNLVTVAGCNVVVDDILYFGESFFQDGAIAQAVDAAVASGTSYFAAVGNEGTLGYDSPFRTTGTDLSAVDYPDLTPGFFAHDFDPGPGVDNLQSVTFPPGTTRLVLQWDQPFFANSGAPGASTDLDFAVVDGVGGVIALSFNSNFGNNPVEVLVVNNGSASPASAYLVIGNTYPLGSSSNPLGPAPDHMKILVFGPPGFSFDEYNAPVSTCVGHPNAAGAIGVGAAFYGNTPAFGITPPTLETFSSRGGSPIFYRTDGTTNDPAVVRLAPALTAPDGGQTSMAFPFANFFGTSAAAPHAAAVAALLQQNAGGGLTPAQIRSFLTSTAVDILPAGYDFDSGAGLLDARAALAAAFAAPITNPDTVQREPNRSIKIPVAQILSNDADPNGDPVTLVGVSSPTSGTATVTVEGGFIIYRAPVGNLTDTIHYTVTDGLGHNRSEAITVNVGAVDDGLGRPNVTSIVADLPAVGDMTLNFVGVPGRSYQVQYTTSATLPASWTSLTTVAASSNGRFTAVDTAPPPPSRFYRAVEAP